MIPALQELHWLPVAERIQYKLCLLVHKSLPGHTPKYISDLLTYSRSIYTRRLIVWQSRRAVDTSTNWRQSLFCCCTASMEQAADGVETAAIDRLVAILKYFCLILFTGTRIRMDSVMRPRSSSRKRNTSVSVTVTVENLTILVPMFKHRILKTFLPFLLICDVCMPHVYYLWRLKYS